MKQLLVGFVLIIFGAGCATVAPYEREYFSKPSMDAEKEGTEWEFRSHVHDAREGATGGNGSTGGGCGCN